MEHYIHSVPGRIRVKLPRIKNKQHRCREVERLITKSLSGIHRAEANAVTGSVVVKFAAEHSEPQLILEVLKEHGYFDASKAVSHDQYVQTVAAQAGQKLVKAAFGWAAGRALEANGLSLLAALI